MNTTEFQDIVFELQKYHGVFTGFWNLGKPQETDAISTAAIKFDAKGKGIEFLINPVFWNACSRTKKSFVICHECLHVMLNHGIRTINVPVEHRSILNVAEDISINHMLVKSFGFNRNDIEGWEDLCWIDTVFPDKAKEILPDMHFEYYYNLLKNDPDRKITCTLVDSHDFFNDLPKEVQDQLESMMDHLSSEELQALRDSCDDKSVDYPMPGILAGNLTVRISAKKVKTKRKWETVIKRWSSYRYRQSVKDSEQWARINRRFALLNRDFFIPTEMESDAKSHIKNKIELCFFLDTSGSCSHLAERFWRAADSLSKDKFKIHLYCFDTKVYKTDIKARKLYGFGGTTFTCIDRCINAMPKHPAAIFIITDGYGNNVRPVKPKKWHWFLTSSHTECIPKACNVFKLSEYE